MEWTKDQKNVILNRGKDILVSAAAGSGKTAVLVERIINRILYDENPIDIDRLLVLTFTNEAAREMKGRIRKAIDKKIESNPRDKRLQKQKTLLSNAQITTIDAFCKYVISNNFQEVGVDPNFRIIDESEALLLKEKALDETLERNYSEPSVEFKRFFRAYKKKNQDESIREYIKAIADKCDAIPWPDKWLDSLICNYEVESVEDLEKLSWVQDIFKYYRSSVAGTIDRINDLADSVREEYGYVQFAEFLRSDQDQLLPLLAIEKPFDFFDALKKVKFQTIKPFEAKGKPEYQEIKGLRDKIKDNMPDKKKMIAKSEVDMEDGSLIKSLQEMKVYAAEFVRLVREYLDSYKAKKDEINGLDYADLEHEALKILVDSETEEETSVAKIFQDYYEEVMVDEYQDSNEIQDLLLRTISGGSIGKHNYFCVGDVKQSIYGFRNADPGIFMRKFENFKDENDEHVRIDLSMNFRSRDDVLNVTNDLFYKIMDKDLGDVGYDDEVRLNYGAEGFYPKDDDGHFAPEVWYAIPEDEELEAMNCDDVDTYEYHFIASKIRDMVDSGFLITDRDENDEAVMRPVRYSDIAILRRSCTDKNGKMTVFLDVLKQYGIDAVLAESSGFFETMEIETILSFLEILDNPLKDVDLMAVLTSLIGNLSEDDLFRVRRAFPEDDLFIALKKYVNEFDDECAVKVSAFIDFYEEIRADVDLSISDIINKICIERGFLDYISSLPGGALRRANVLKLLDLAAMNESKSSDLYTFMDYIRKRKKYKSEIGMANLMGDEDNVVRIMTIHKSKGLEFPVVFLSGCGNEFNLSDAKGRVLLDMEHGLALKQITGGKYRMFKSNFFTNSMATLITGSQKGEELRILYVAMTRAKEKLIISGKISTRSKDKEKAVIDLLAPIGQKMDFAKKAKADCYLKWIIPALNSYNTPASTRYDFRKINLNHFIEGETKSILSDEEKKNEILNLNRSASDKNLDSLLDRLSFEYEFDKASNFKNKYSVSEIKHLEIDKAFNKIDEGTFKEDFDAEVLFGEDESEESVIKKKLPRFISGEKSNTMSATSYGTAMHRALEGLDMTIEYDEETIEKAINEMALRGFLKPEEAKAVKRKSLLSYLNSEMKDRLIEAAKSGNLLREQNFVFSERIDILFKDLSVDLDTDRSVLVQGEIDCLLVEDEGVTVIDYKTDRVKSDKELLDMYSRQLQIYGNAASRTFGKKINQLLIYSFALDRFIEVLPL